MVSGSAEPAVRAWHLIVPLAVLLLPPHQSSVEIAAPRWVEKLTLDSFTEGFGNLGCHYEPFVLCHREPFAFCHSERSEESHTVQDKPREELGDPSLLLRVTVNVQDKLRAAPPYAQPQDSSVALPWKGSLRITERVEIATALYVLQ